MGRYFIVNFFYWLIHGSFDATNEQAFHRFSENVSYKFCLSTNKITLKPKGIVIKTPHIVIPCPLSLKICMEGVSRKPVAWKWRPLEN